MSFGAGKGAAAILCLVSAAGLLLIAAVLRLWVGDGWWYLIPLAAYGVLRWYTARWVQSLGGTADEKHIFVRYGVLWRRETVVPLRALRTFETFVPPLHRLFRCRTVVLRFAGGSVWVPLLAEETAQKLARRLETG